MARLIHDKIKQPLAHEILFGKLTDGGSVSVEEKDGELFRFEFLRSPDSRSSLGRFASGGHRGYESAFVYAVEHSGNGFVDDGFDHGGLSFAQQF
jgi:hypothetical protein